MYRTVLGLAGHGTHVVLCTRRSGYADAPLTANRRRELASQGVFVHPIELAPLRKAFAPRRLLAGLRGAYGRPQAIVAHLGKNAFRSLPLGALADAPILAIFHGEDANLDVRDPRYRERFERWFASPGAVALGVADHLTRKLVAAGFPPERAYTHHLGIDLAAHLQRPRHEGHGPLRLALSGRLMSVKGHRTAFEALAIARKDVPGSELHVFGAGPLESTLRERAKALALMPAVHFRGALPVDVLRAELAGSDVILQPSEVDAEGREEGIPNSILEAMALGLPVIATHHGGIPEAVDDGETGRLVAERAPEELAQAIVELADPALREKFGRAGRAKVEAEYAQELRGVALAERILEARDAYTTIPRSVRRAAWRATVEGYVEAPEAIGRRERLRWPVRLLVNRWRQEIP
ncbi:MAG: colanic acid biosynthesis glycosyltransferase WcaL [bacterium]|nr:colanic acid biosynthesis glycosyltransferase WcaL [bacterium]